MKKQIAEYAKSILNVSHAVRSIRSLYNLLSSYRNRHTVTYPGHLGARYTSLGTQTLAPEKGFLTFYLKIFF